MKKIKSIIKENFPEKLFKSVQFFREKYTDIYALKSYSQEGEDMILRRFFERKEIGFYIDVGAHHPKRFSNTYYFYKKGWRGINIDAMPKSMEVSRKVRPKDINIEMAINDQDCEMTYYEFNEPALNGFSKNLSELRSDSKNYYIINRYMLQTRSLDEVLEGSFDDDVLDIDFLNIDVEGLDFNVIRSINLNKYRPKLILIEILSSNFVEVLNDDISLYLRDYNYEIYAKSFNTVFFIDTKYCRKVFN